MTVYRIYFIDLVGLIRGPQGRATVVLPDARESRPFHTSMGEELAIHQPILVYDADDAPASDRATAVDLVATFQTGDLDLVVNRRLGALELNDLELTIGDPQSASLEFKDNGAPLSQLPNSSTFAGGMDWLPTLSEASPRGGQISDEVLQPQPPPGLIAARVRLTEGVLKTARIYGTVDVSNGSPVSILPTFRFANLAGNLESDADPRSIADIFYLEIVKDGPLVIPITSLKDGTQVRTLTLSRQNGDCEVLIANVSPLAASTQELDSTHFEIYYELAENRPPLSQRPVPRVSERNPGNRAPGGIDSDAFRAFFGRIRGPRNPTDRPSCPACVYSEHGSA